MERIDKDEYYLDMARTAAGRSTCRRRKYGAVLVKDDEIVATGYNGAARGEPNCCDAGICYREALGIPHGEQYEKCVAVHAEANALLSASRSEAIGATLYLAGFEAETGEEIVALPCVMCARLLKNAGISAFVNISGRIE